MEKHLRLKNWLYKQGFGADYAEKVYESNSNRSAPNESTSGEIKISGNDLSSTILKMSKAHDEPFADAANLALYSMCMQLPENIKVVLQVMVEMSFSEDIEDMQCYEILNYGRLSPIF